MADASHELRTPLTALRLRLENGDSDAALHEADRLGRLVDELLALARADAPVPAATDVDLAEVARRRVEQWEPLAAEYGVRLAASVTAASSMRAGHGSSKYSTTCCRTRSTHLHATRRSSSTCAAPSCTSSTRVWA